MINHAIAELDNRLSGPAFFDFLALLNVDDALDRRDEPAFDDAWMAAYHALQALSFPADTQALIDALREKAFKHAFRVIGDAEVAGRIADDIDLIAKILAAGQEKGWAVTQLWSAYLHGRFPVTAEGA